MAASTGRSAMLKKGKVSKYRRPALGGHAGSIPFAGDVSEP